MKISFVIPAYNEESRIAACLDAIRKELSRGSYDAEIIVVNNASTDRTKEIALSFPGVRVVDEPQKGLTHARQAGFKASTGDLIAQIDADSLLTPHWIDTVLEAFAHNARLVGLSGPYYYYDLPPFQRAVSSLFQFAGFLAYLLNRFVLNVGSQLMGGNCVVRRTALEAIGGYDTTIEFYGEDVDVARRLHPLGDVKWTYRLPIRSSGRRLKHEGLMTTGITYVRNFLATIFWRSSLEQQHVDVRD